MFFKQKLAFAEIQPSHCRGKRSGGCKIPIFHRVLASSSQSLFVLIVLLMENIQMQREREGLSIFTNAQERVPAAMMFYLLNSSECSRIQIPSGPPRSFQTELFQISPSHKRQLTRLQQKMRNFPRLIFHPFPNFLLTQLFQLFTTANSH